MLDLCHGLDVSVAYMLLFMELNPAFSSVVVMVKLMRGRDTVSAPFRDLVSVTCHGEGSLESTNKNRGVLLLPLYAYCLVTGFAAGRRLDTAEWSERVDSLVKRFKPVFDSYRSGVLVFDSVVMTLPVHPADMERSAIARGHTDTQDKARKLRIGCKEILGHYQHGAMKTKRRVSAMLAVRTMRQNGQIRSAAPPNG